MPGPISPRVETSSVEHPQTEAAPSGSAPPPPPGKDGVTKYDPSELTALLSTDVSRFDFFVTGKEAKAALAKLEQLEPAEFYAAMQALSKGGQLETLLDKLSWADQCRFLALAADKGSIERTPAEPGKGPLDPPGQPALFHMSREFPRCLNDLIHEHSKAQFAEYTREYTAYSARYEEAVGKCTSLRDIQKLGPPAPIDVAREHVAIGDPLEDAYAVDFGKQRAPTPTHAYLAVADRMSELTGEKRDGAAWFEVKLEFAYGPAVAEVGGRLGPHEQKLEKKAGVAVGGVLAPGLVGEAREMSDGSSTGTVVLGPVEASTTIKDGKAEKVAVGGGGAKVTLERGGAQLDLDLAKSGPAKGGVWAAGNRKQAEVRAGLHGSVKVGDAAAKAQVGAGARVLREETVRRALSNSHDVFKVPPELEAGTKWSALPPARREALEKFGWTPDDWATALAGGAS